MAVLGQPDIHAPDGPGQVNWRPDGSIVNAKQGAYEALRSCDHCHSTRPHLQAAMPMNARIRLRALGGLLLVVSASTRAQDRVDLIIFNAKITTQTDAEQVTAVALGGKTILHVGDDTTILALRTPKTKIIDADGRRLIPGLNDSHMQRGSRCTGWFRARALEEPRCFPARTVSVARRRSSSTRSAVPGSAARKPSRDALRRDSWPIWRC